MATLVLETSTERSVVALFHHDRCLFEEQLPFGLQSSDFLLPAFQRKIEELDFHTKDLTSIVVGVGPGSYTGIRVGATIAKCLSFALGIPLFGICTLETFIPDCEGTFVVLIDAKIGGVYMQKGFLENGEVRMASQPQTYPLEEAAKLLYDIPTIVTPYAEKIRLKLEALIPDHQWHWQESYPSAWHMMQMAQKQKTRNPTPDNTRLELLYLRKTQAEIEKGR